MVDTADQVDTIEERSDLGSDDAARFEYWEKQHAVADREERKWRKRGQEIVKRYRDERPESMQNQHRFNILWSNVQTLIPTLYGRTPKPDVERRFKDADPSGRLAAILMERCLAYSVDAFDFDDVIEAVVEDRLLPGRGTARVLYVPHFGNEIKDSALAEGDEDEGEEDEEDADAESEASTVADAGGESAKKADEPLREVVWEEVIADYQFWTDYHEGPARKWREVPWISFDSYLTRDELTTRFGKKKAKQVSLDYTPSGKPDSAKEDAPADVYKKAKVREVWDKVKREVIWYAPGTPDLILDRLPDPLRLPDFFPAPPALRSTATNDKRIPVADYVEYQDQARELDTLTARIDKLTKALKLSGVYAGDEKQILQQLIDDGTENKLIPVGDIQSWADKGGLSQIIQWMPIQQVAETLIQLYNARDKVKATLYELTGIGDIMRGMTSPDETYGAQKLKANFSTRRISPQQKKVAKFARSLLRLMAGVIAEHFSAKTISMITGYPQLEPVPALAAKPMPPVALPMLASPMAPAMEQAPPGGEPGQPPPPDPRLQAYQQAMAQWQQQAQQVQQIEQANRQKQQQFDAAVALIKRDGVHGFRIDIEADSTIAPDEEAEKQARTEFMTGFIPLMQQVVPMAQGNPAMADLAKEITLFVVRGFRVARPLEESIEKAFDAFAKMPAPQPAGKGQGPDSPADLALRAKETDNRLTIANQQDSTKLTIAREKNAIETAKLGTEMHLKTAEMAASEVAERMKSGLEAERAADEAHFRNTRAGAIEAREASRLT